MSETPLDRVKSLDAIADGLREAIGEDEWWDVPQGVRLSIVLHVRATVDAALSAQSERAEVER